MAIREIPAMPFVESVKQTLTQNYCNFNGRARRSEFWFFQLFYTIIYVVLTIIIGISETFGGILSCVVTLGLLLPSLSVSVRRLHDINKSGWWLLISLIPLVGFIVLLVWACKDSDPLPNQYGPSTKYIDVE